MVCFSLFGVRVTIHPSIWAVLALMGYMLSGGEFGLLGVALFVVAGFFSLLAHEMGHALVGRSLGGGIPMVELAWLGGACVNEEVKLSRTGRVLTTLAGPLASVALALPVLGWLIAAGGSLGNGLYLLGGMILGMMPAVLVEQYPPMLALFAAYLVQVGVWWGVLNLLPIYPLDGGLIMTSLMHSPRKVHLFSMIAAIALALLALYMGFLFMVFLLALLAFVNYNGIRNSPY
ncbi:MAG: hypothetical protein Q4A24_03185 [Akkermansia sp.]|nr:hypothetical protein [Akkermansia sp.]